MRPVEYKQVNTTHRLDMNGPGKSYNALTTPVLMMDPSVIAVEEVATKNPAMTSCTPDSTVLGPNIMAMLLM